MRSDNLQVDGAGTEALDTQPASSGELPTPCFGGQKYCVESTMGNGF